MTKRGMCALLAGMIVAGAGAGLAAGVPKLKPVVSGYQDSRGGALSQPEGAAYDGKSLVVVADTGNGRLVEYRLEGERLAPIREIAIPQLPYPVRVQVDPAGGIVALDGKRRRIVRISPAGEFRGYVEPKDADAAAGLVPRGFGVGRDGTVYVLDARSARVLALDPDGKVVRGLAYPREAGFFSDLAVDGSGTLFLVDSVGRRVFSARGDSTAIAPLSGSLADDLNFPTSLAADARGNLLVVDQNGGGIVVLGRDGAFRGRQLGMGWREGLLRYPSQICAGADGTVVVADRGNNRVQVFRSID